MLSDEAKVILDIEAGRYLQSGHKDATIASQLGMTPTRYYQRLNDLLDNREALEHSPALMNRLRRLRDTRARRRTSDT